MTKIKNGAKVPHVSQLTEEVKTKLNQEAQDHDFTSEELEEQPPQEDPTLDQQPIATQAANHIIQMRKEVSAEIDKVKHPSAASITNTITNCGIFVSLGTTMGAKYATNIDMFKLVSLSAMEARAKTYVKGVDDAETANNYAIAERKGEFDGLAPLCALIVAEMVMSNASPETISQLRTLLRELRGERKVPKDPSKPNAVYRSVSQLNYDDVAANFARLILMIAADPNYNPATESLTLIALNAKLTSLQDANTNIQIKNAELDAARIARNEFFNADVVGLCDTFINAKKVVLTNFGRSSEQYKKVSGLAFRKIKTR